MPLTFRFPLQCIFLLGMLLFVSAPCQAADIFFDQAHGQAFVIEKDGPLDLSGLSNIFTEQGLTTKVNTTQLTPEGLSAIQSLVISGPFANFTDQEVDALMEWLYHGGRLSLMLHIPNPVNPLLRKLGVVVSYTPISERENVIENNPKNFSVTTLADHPITAGLKSFNVYGIWGVMNFAENAKVISTASPQSWVDMNRDNKLGEGDGVYPYGLIVVGSIGEGEFVVFGDDAIFQNQFLKEENRQLAINLAHWLQKE